MRAIWALLVTIIFTLIFGLSGIFISLFESKKGHALGHCARLWAKYILFFTGVKYSIKGLSGLDVNSNYIFAGNHTSVFDIPLAFATLPFWLVPIAKVELRSVFILGWVMNTAGHIWVDRKNTESALKSLEFAKNSLMDMPRSILLFPEGTRTRDGSLAPFKPGGLLIAVDTDIPIVPIAFVGTYEMLKPRSWSMKYHPIELRVGEPINPGEYSIDTRRELANYVRDKVEALKQ